MSEKISAEESQHLNLEEANAEIARLRAHYAAANAPRTPLSPNR